jgi:cob(I)alamin adenosyltransferase
MRLADAGRTEEDDVLGALDKGQAGELTELLARYAGGPKSKPSSVLTVGKPATRANISRARARRASRSARRIASRKSANEADFAAALCAITE